jgi:hypothetical protein
MEIPSHRSANSVTRKLPRYHEFKRQPSPNRRSQQLPVHKSWSSIVSGNNGVTSASMDSFRRRRHISSSSRYMGWRSSENLHQEINYNSPAQRLAQSIHHPQRSHSHNHLSDVTTEPRHQQDFNSHGIHDSIKSVTSSIIAYCGENSVVNGHRTAEKLDSKKQHSRLVWVESSFVSSNVQLV